MTTISPGASAADAMLSRRLVIEPGNEVTAFRRGTRSVTEMPDYMQAKATSEATVAAAEKQLLEVKKRTSSAGMENHEMYLPNVSTMSLENARKSLGITQVMIDNREDKGLNVQGHNGDQKISDLNSYKAALTDYISKYEAALSKATAGESTAPSTASTTAASLYRQMQGMVSSDGNS